MHAEYDCLWQSASGAQSGTSSSRIEEFREFEEDLSALFCNFYKTLMLYVFCFLPQSGTMVL